MVNFAHNPPPTEACEDLIRQVESLRSEIARDAAAGGPVLAGLPPHRRTSAKNLMHYLALRRRDLRSMQDQLSRLGLSSLGRLEPHVLATLDLVLDHLYRMSGQEPPVLDLPAARATFDRSANLLEENTASLLGPQPENRRVHIMVTMPAEAADDYMMVHQLLVSGMNCMRINGSKDGPPTWLRLIEHLRNAQRATGKECRILLDLGGPKMRTGPMQTQPAILKVRPARARDGQVLRPARIWLNPGVNDQGGMNAADAILRVDRDWFEKINSGDIIRMRDARRAKRVWRITEVNSNGCWAECRKTVYFSNGIVLRLHGASGVHPTDVNGLEEQETPLLVRKDDVLFLSVEDQPGKPASLDETGRLLTPGSIALPIPEIYRDARPGETVYFDDGRISAIIEKVLPGQLQLRITNTNKPVEKLTGDRGVNFPDTHLDLPALSGKDLQDLDFAARHADIAGLSFTNCAADVSALRQRLAELGREDMAVVLKIETRRGFSNLPEILIEALKCHAAGVMIARGDLAVECGFERMAELQEEILWICEATHTPVIWATQVLENLTRRGFASRAEITDAAMGQSAEAVMLNKGPHIVNAVETLDNILRRMQGHHNKKQSMMRRLELASSLNTPFAGSE